MLKFLQKNKTYVAVAVLFAILYFYGNNMEFYDNHKKCGQPIPDQFPNYKGPYLDPTDDTVLERKDLKQLQREKIGRFNYDGLDNWNVISDVKKGWWSEHVQAGGLYPSPVRMQWPD